MNFIKEFEQETCEHQTLIFGIDSHDIASALRKVLVGYKVVQDKPGSNKFNGPGGKMSEEDQGSSEECAKREFGEEFGASIYNTKLHLFATLYSINEDRINAKVDLYIVLLNDIEGELMESPEMRPQYMYRSTIKKVPKDQMRENLYRILPQIFDRKEGDPVKTYQTKNKKGNVMEYFVEAQ